MLLLKELFKFVLERILALEDLQASLHFADLHILFDENLGQFKQASIELSPHHEVLPLRGDVLVHLQLDVIIGDHLAYAGLFFDVLQF